MNEAMHTYFSAGIGNSNNFSNNCSGCPGIVERSLRISSNDNLVLTSPQALEVMIVALGSSYGTPFTPMPRLSPALVLMSDKLFGRC